MAAERRRSAAGRAPRLAAGTDGRDADWLSGRQPEWIVHVLAQPGASRTESVGTHDACLKLRVAAPPVDGRANEEIIRWFARRLGIGRRQVSILTGEGARRKRIGLRVDSDAATLVRTLAGRDADA